MGGFGYSFTDTLNSITNNLRELLNEDVDRIATMFNAATLDDVVAYQFENLLNANDGATIMEAMI